MKILLKEPSIRKLNCMVAVSIEVFCAKYALQNLVHEMKDIILFNEKYDSNIVEKKGSYYEKVKFRSFN